MCGACGILQNDRDWTDGFGFQSGNIASHLVLAERRRRLALVNDLLAPTGIHLREQGRQLILSSQTGKTVVVTSLAHVWREADRLSHKMADPLNF